MVTVRIRGSGGQLGLALGLGLGLWIGLKSGIQVRVWHSGYCSRASKSYFQRRSFLSLTLTNLCLSRGALLLWSSKNDVANAGRDSTCVHVHLTDLKTQQHRHVVRIQKDFKPDSLNQNYRIRVSFALVVGLRLGPGVED